MAINPIENHVAEALADYLRQNKAVTEAVNVTEEAPVVEVKPVVLGENQQLFSTLFGAVPSFGDFAVTVNTEVSEQMKSHMHKLDTNYVVQLEEAARLVMAIETNDKTLITGPTGSGKSSLVKYVCTKLGLPFIRINMSGDVESSAIFGSLIVRGGATVWQDGPMTEALKYGAVVLVDEWELMPPEISMGLQNVLEDDGFLFLKEMPGTAEDKTIFPHKNSRLIFAGNTVGQGDDSGNYSGTSVQNNATLDRFSTTIVLSYLDKEHEINIITSKTTVDKKLARRMVNLAELVRSAHNTMQINLTLSPRTLINWGRKIVQYNGNIQLAFTVAFLDKLRESDKKAVNELFNKVFK